MAARHEEGCYEQNVFMCFLLFAKDYQTMTSGSQRVIVFQEIRPGADFKTGDFVEDKLGAGVT